jgi:hypothetical protein
LLFFGSGESKKTLPAPICRSKSYYHERKLILLALLTKPFFSTQTYFAVFL